MSTVTFMYELGDKVSCRVTGFEGIIDQRSECLNGCLRYSVTGRVTKEGEAKGWWIDEGQLEKIDDGLNKTKSIKKTKTGAPMARSR